MEQIKHLETRIQTEINVAAKRVDQVESFFTVVHQLHGEHTQRALIPKAQQLARTLWNAEAALMFWEEGGRLLYQHHPDAPPESIGLMKSCAETRVFRTKLPEWGEDGAGHSGSAAFATGIHNWVVVPMIVSQKTIGVLQIVNRLDGPFGGADLPMLQALGSQIGVAWIRAAEQAAARAQLLRTAEALASAVDMKDPYTGEHTRRVTHFSLAIAKEMGLAEEALEALKLGAIFHDIGKIGIADQILQKKTGLTPAEFSVMKRHPELGYEMLGHIEGLEPALAGIRFHHERFDGQGYPLGLKGEQIPLMARIIAVADSFDAIVSTRQYRAGRGIQEALEEIQIGAGTQFCPQVVDAFFKAFQNQDLAHYVEVVIKQIFGARAS